MNLQIKATDLAIITGIMPSKFCNLGHTFYFIMEMNNNWELYERCPVSEALDSVFREKRTKTIRPSVILPKPVILPDNFDDALKHSNMDYEDTTREWGNQQEKKNIDKYQKAYGVQVKSCQELRSLKISDDITIMGRIDGETDDCLLEFKSRKKQLFHELRDYERVQCEAYMRIWDKPLKLVESYKNDMNVIDVERDDFFWEHILFKLKEFVKLYKKVLNDKKLMDELRQSFCFFENKHETTKFLERIRQKEKPTLSLDCDSDSD